jgi:hypothetical protein
MFTVLMTFVGIIVFAVSLIKRGFKTAFGRLLAFILTGVVADIVLLLTIGTIAYHTL